MKKVFLSFLVLAVISCSKKEIKVDYTVVSGKIENLNGDVFSIRNSKGIIKDIDVLKDGTFSDTIKNIEPGYYVFR